MSDIPASLIASTGAAIKLMISAFFNVAFETTPPSLV